MKRPNFFIIGAPKCGTTSMANWLAEHPRIFMSPIKEPCFFCHQLPVYRERWKGREKDYDRLFEKACDQHIAIGEASTQYLYYANSTIPLILSYSPEAKFVVMLRNPAEMAPSLHEQRFFSGDEDQEDFSVAWSLQEARAEGRRIPKLCPRADFLQYGNWCRLGTQVETLLGIVPRQRCHFVFLEDVKADPGAAYSSILSFLGLPDDGRTRFPAVNTAKTHRSRLLAAAARHGHRLRRVLGISPVGGFGILSAIIRLNTKARPRRPSSAEMRRVLIEYFRPEVAKLEEIFARDLSSWLVSPDISPRPASSVENENA